MPVYLVPVALVFVVLIGNAADVGGNGCGGWWNGISCWRCC